MRKFQYLNKVIPIFLFSCLILTYVRQNQTLVREETLPETPNPATLVVPPEKNVNTKEPSLKNTENPLDLQIKNRFEKRLQLLKEKCPQAAYVRLTKDELPDRHFLFTSKYDLFVCIVNKAGSTTWKTHIKFMDKALPEKYRFFELNKNQDLVNSLIHSKTSSKVFTVREPIDRLTSAYREAFNLGQEKPDDKELKYFFDGAEKELNISLGVAGHRTLSFSVTEKYSKRRHYCSAASSCTPCDIEYDYIVHRETFTQDVRYIFQRLNVTGTKATLQKHRTYSRANPEEYFKGIDPGLLYRVYEQLKDDYLLFGYEVPEVFKSPIDYVNKRNKTKNLVQ